jgi:MscS family membrane protein
LTLVIQLSAMRFLGFPLSFRIAYAHVGLVVLVIALTWLAAPGSDPRFARTRTMVWGRDSASTQSLLLLGERLAKVLILVIAVIAILTIVGCEHQNRARAASALAAWRSRSAHRRTVENLLGGVFLLSDRALAVGDTAASRIASGSVEDITLRSVRLRTLEQTLLSIPAGTLSQASVENFATRAKILSQTTLRVRYGTTAEQLDRYSPGFSV